ncbi:MAG: DUF3037 domain-containing protein [Betaproteobacteria bacterium]
MSAALERLRALATPLPAPKVAGQWFSIRYSPSVSAGEIFNVGVAYVDSDKQSVQARLIENLEGFRTLFGEAFEEEVRFALDVVRSSLRQAMLQSPMRSIAFSERRYAAGGSPQDILNWLFSTTVSFAEAKQTAGATRRDPAPNNAAVRKAVFDEIRLKAELRADQIIPADPIYWVTEGDRRVPLDIPLRGPRLLGSVVSAGQRSRLPLENNLLRSSLDLETAASIFKRDRLGFFVMRSSLPASIDDGLDDVIDTTCWKLHKQGVHVGIEDTPARLADEILDWSGI